MLDLAPILLGMNRQAEVRVPHEEEAIEGGTVLSGFRLTIRDWFARPGRRRNHG